LGALAWLTVDPHARLAQIGSTQLRRELSGS
jgi:hypothetical protein